jgi:hypothetical protein
MAPGRQKINASIFTQTAIPSSWRIFINIPTLHHFSATRVLRIETLMHILKHRKETLGWIACYTTSYTHNYLPTTDLKPTFMHPATPLRS